MAGSTFAAGAAAAAEEDEKEEEEGAERWAKRLWRPAGDTEELRGRTTVACGRVVHTAAGLQGRGFQ